MKFLKSTFLTALLALIGGAVYAGCTAKAFYTQSGNTVTFYNDSSTSVTGNHTLSWNFGDGNTGSGDQVVHRYAPGTYTATLTLTDSTFCTDTTVMTITVSNNTGGGCTAKARVSYTQNGSSVTITDDSSSTSSSNGYYLNIDYGNSYSSISTSGGTYIYPNSGTYNLCVTIHDNRDSACFDTKCFSVTIPNTGGGNNCNASFSYGVDSANSLKYYFSGSTPVGGVGGTSPLWEISQNSQNILSVPSQNLTYTFTSTGIYNVKYSLIDSSGNTCDFVTKTVTVISNGGGNCVASFTHLASSPNSLKYTFSGSAPSLGGSASWEIKNNVGVGSKTYTGQNITHTFSGAGTYSVKYSLLDSNGSVCDTESKNILVINNTPTCKASYYVGIDSANKFGLYLINNSTGTNRNTQYTWDFGDGTTSNAQYPTHQYANFGIYNVCLTIFDSNTNCYSTYCDTVGMDSNGNILKLSGFGITVIDEAMLGVEEPSMFTGVNVYPNPSSGKFTFAIDSKKGTNMTMQVMNSMGQVVAVNETYLTVGSNKTQLDLSSLSDGLYFVNLRAGDEVKNVRLYLAR